MFTSRAEFRLHLRIDNADRRLTPHGRRLGLIDDAAWTAYQAKMARAEAFEKLLGRERVGDAAGLVLSELVGMKGQTYSQVLKRPEMTVEVLWPALLELVGKVPELSAWSVDGERLSAWVRNEMKTVETEIKYSGYLDQQRRSIEKMRKAEKRTIPEWFDYAAVSGLSTEMKQTLTRVRPQTLGQASRIAGVTPAAVSLIHVYIEIQGRVRVA
jgi:tRNA uridine 5-carboxymethylaminomethyl modification enzyme